MTDRAILSITAAAASAAASATVRTRADLRARVLRLNRQARFNAAWGLRLSRP